MTKYEQIVALLLTAEGTLLTYRQIAARFCTNIGYVAAIARKQGISRMNRPVRRGVHLTQNEVRLLLFMIERPVAPTVREIAAHMGWRSTNAAWDHFAVLARKGWVRLLKGSKARNMIELLPFPVPPPFLLKPRFCAQCRSNLEDGACTVCGWKLRE